MFYTYILYSQSIGKYYIGYTSMTVEERLHKHLTNHKGFTGQAKDWKIVYSEVFETKKEASNREKEIKNKKSKKYIEKLIEQSISKINVIKL